jgi:hypothetical protein
MSSLQKFHRRTQTSGGGAFSFTTIGSGDATHGFWLGTAGDGISKLIVAPLSTEFTSLQWGSYGSVRGTTSTTNGLSNTNTLYAFGTFAHPAAGLCRALSTGGYNTWYLPAKDELTTCYSNKSATPFSTANAFGGRYRWSSTESGGNYAWRKDFVNGNAVIYGKNNPLYARAVRMV